MSSKTALVPTTDPRPMYLDLDPVALGAYALDNRMEMLELELRLAIDAATVDFEKNAALPLVTVDYSYNMNGLNSSFGGAFQQVADGTFTGWTVGLNAEIPIGNEAAKARVSRAILTRIQRLATREQRRLAILQEVYDAVDLLNQEWQRIIAARQASILAARTYEGERRQFEVGVRTSTDVLDAAARLADAQSSEVSALADYEIARVDIAFGTGTLLGHVNVLWAPSPPASR
jgi:outer membrane protein TolC